MAVERLRSTARQLLILSVLACLLASAVCAAKGATQAAAGETVFLVIDPDDYGIPVRDYGKLERQLGANLTFIDVDSIQVVSGETLNGPERASLAAMEAKYPMVFKNTVSASKTSVARLGGGGKLVVLVGGPSQNSVTKELSQKRMLSQERVEVLNQLVLSTAKTGDGTKFIIVSDKRGYANMQRNGASYSPLALCLPLQLVPVVASAIGALIASAMHPLMNLFQSFIENIISDSAKKRRKITEGARRIFRLKVREALSVIASAFVLGIAITWTYAGPTWDFLWLLILNVIVCLLAGFSHEATHWIMGRLMGVETEYRFWPSGSIATLFTAFLGNPFGLQGFLMDEPKEGTPKWKVGLMKLASPLVSTAIMVAFAAVNFFVPNVAFQMVYSIAGVVAMAEMLPFKPMDGYDIRRWSIIVWLLSFLGISAAYVSVNFLL